MGGIRGQGEDIHSFIEGKDKKAGRYEPEAPRHPQPAKKFTNEGVSSGNTGLLTWNTEEVDAPKYFHRLFRPTHLRSHVYNRYLVITKPTANVMRNFTVGTRGAVSLRVCGLGLNP